MTPESRFTLRRGLTLCLTATSLWLAGCAAQRLHDEGLEQIRQGQERSGLDQLRQAAQMDSGNARFRIDYLNQRQFVVQRRLDQAERDWQAGRIDAAQKVLQEALAVDPDNGRAQRALLLIEARRRLDTQVQRAERQLAANQPEAARDTLLLVLREQPQHAPARALLRVTDERIATLRGEREDKLGSRAALRKPVTLQFRDAPLRQVFEAISRATGINIILDRDVSSGLRSTIFVRDATVEDSIDLILMQSQLERRQLNANTLLVYPATPAKQKEYAELRVRSFQLSNADAAHIANLIKTMLKTRDVVTDARTNTLIMRDSADAIAVAEQIVAANDVPEPEVMLEVEVLEVAAARASEIGIKWPTAIGLSTPQQYLKDSTGAITTTVDPLTWAGLRATTANSLLVPQLSGAINLQLTDTDTNILASPRIRARHKEKAKIMVGDKVPVITNVLASQGSSVTGTATNNFITGSIQYLDVGLKLEVEPQVYAEGDVAIKINLEVSNVAREISTQSGTAYQIGTRNAQTVLRLKDGETQVLAGLISHEDRNSATKVPGLGQLPVLGRLFRSDKDANTKSEIVLSITPHIIRPLLVPEGALADIYAGSEATVKSRPLRLDPIEAVRTPGSIGAPVRPAVAPAVAAPAPVAPPVAPVAPAVQAVPPEPPADEPETVVTPVAPPPPTRP